VNVEPVQSRGAGVRRRRVARRPASRVLALVAVVTLTQAPLLAISTATPSPATAAESAPPSAPHPFGLSCTDKYGIRFCPGGMQGSRDLRVRSFDGVPLDADVALPAHGNGPFPLVVLLHGLGQSKTEYEVTENDNAIDDVSLADRGYAVVMYTARGFGESCGVASSRTPDCAHGWIHLADQRYEVRDTQYLAGLLVDEGFAKPAIAVAGVSYGGGQSLELAMLKNRMRLPDGDFVPFTSPQRHVAMSVAAAYAIWPWDDLDSALVPNGNLSAETFTPPSADQTPIGVPKDSWVTELFAVVASYYLAPAHADPQSDLSAWEAVTLRGEPQTPLDEQAEAFLQKDKSAAGIPMPPGGPAPTAIQNGWTDTLFPATEGLHYTARVRAAGDHTPILMMFDDVGHGWAQDKLPDVAVTNRAGLAFIGAAMLTHTTPRSGVIAIPQTCPQSAPSGTPQSAATLGALQHGHLTLSGAATQQVTSAGGDPATSAALNPAYVSQLCDSLPAAPEAGTAVYTSAVGPHGATLLGAPHVSADITVTGDYPEIVGRLWDVRPDQTRQIVSLGVFRPSVNQTPGTPPSATGTEHVIFELDPNEYHFAPGDTAELELVGSNAPFFRASNGTFTITVHGLTATLPTA